MNPLSCIQNFETNSLKNLHVVNPGHASLWRQRKTGYSKGKITNLLLSKNIITDKWKKSYELPHIITDCSNPNWLDKHKNCLLVREQTGFLFCYTTSIRL
jgi:hypothetical protein